MKIIKAEFFRAKGLGRHGTPVLVQITDRLYKELKKITPGWDNNKEVVSPSIFPFNSVGEIAGLKPMDKREKTAYPWRVDPISGGSFPGWDVGGNFLKWRFIDSRWRVNETSSWVFSGDKEAERESSFYSEESLLKYLATQTVAYSEDEGKTWKSKTKKIFGQSKLANSLFGKAAPIWK